MAQYLSKYFFEKYEDEEKISASQCWLPVRPSKKPLSVAFMVDVANITLTILIIIWNYIRDAFGKRATLPEYAVNNLGTGYMEADH